MPSVLLMGRPGVILDDIKNRLTVHDVTVFSGSTLQEAIDVLENHAIEMVIMGAKLDLDVRLDIIRHVYRVSRTTSVHLKDVASGGEGMFAFVDWLVSGLVAAKGKTLAKS